MASIDGIRLQERDGTFRSGGAFTLRDPSTETEGTYFDGWRVEIAKDSQVIVTTGGKAASYADALSDSLARAYEGLDDLSVQGIVDLDLKAPWMPTSTCRVATTVANSYDE